MPKQKTAPPPPKPELVYEIEGAPIELFVIRFKPTGTWWGPNGSGYSGELLAAGTYGEAEAMKLAANRPNDDEAMPLKVAVRDYVSGLNPTLVQALIALGAR
jgi:hypothetical protein